MDKFIRVLSPITIAVTAVLDCSVAAFAVYSVRRIMQDISIWTIAFVIIVAITMVIAVLTTREALTNGVKYFADSVEFTAIDENNRFDYADIDHIETIKDTKASLKKNFVDRYSHLIMYMKDDTVVTIDLGLTTKRTLRKIESELNDRI